MSASIYNAILYNAALYGGGVPDPAEPTISWGDMLDCLYPRLHASGASSLVWWTESDLRNWANEALQALSRGALLFVRRDTGNVTVTSQRLYSLPTRHLATLHVAVDNQPLQPTDRDLIDARDSGADAAVCGAGELPTRWYEDTLGLHASIGLYPSPIDADTVAILISQQPELLTSSASTIPIPSCFAPFIEDYVLGRAWDHDSDFSMPELASHFRSKEAIYLDVYRQYWGQGQ